MRLTKLSKKSIRGKELFKAKVQKKSDSHDTNRFLKSYVYSYASVDSKGTTDTNERFSFFLRNSTIPSVKANKV